MMLGFTLTAVDWAEFVSLWRSMQAMRLSKERLDRVIRDPSRDPLGRRKSRTLDTVLAAI